jgi:hypothetical protein
VRDSTTPASATDRDRRERGDDRPRFEISLGDCIEDPDARQWARGTARDRRSLGVGLGVRISRGRTLATTVRCALMPEDILEDSLACGDGSGGKVSLSRGRRDSISLGEAGSRARRKPPRRGRRERRLDAPRPPNAVPGSEDPTASMVSAGHGRMAAPRRDTRDGRVSKTPRFGPDGVPMISR